MLGVLKADSYRLFKGKRLYLAIGLFTLSRLLVAIPEFSVLVKQIGSLTELSQSTGYLYYSSFFLTSPVRTFAVSVVAIPFALAYLEDRSNNFHIYFICRSNIRVYSLSKYLINILSSALVSFLGFLITWLIFVFLSLGNPGSIMAGTHAGFLQSLSINYPWLYGLTLMFFSSLHCALWSSIVLVFSAYLGNIYLILSLTYMSMIIISKLHLSDLGLPILSNLAMQGAWLAIENMSLSLALTLNVLQYGLLFFLFYIFFHHRVKRNYERV